MAAAYSARPSGKDQPMSALSSSAQAQDADSLRIPADPRRWRALLLLALVQFMFALDGTIVNVALPTIKHALNFSTSGLAWVVNGYTLVAAGFLIGGGRGRGIVR